MHKCPIQGRLHSATISEFALKTSIIMCQRRAKDEIEFSWLGVAAIVRIECNDLDPTIRFFRMPFCDLMNAILRGFTVIVAWKTVLIAQPFSHYSCLRNGWHVDYNCRGSFSNKIKFDIPLEVGAEELSKRQNRSVPIAVGSRLVFFRSLANISKRLGQAILEQFVQGKAPRSPSSGVGAHGDCESEKEANCQRFLHTKNSPQFEIARRTLGRNPEEESIGGRGQ